MAGVAQHRNSSDKCDAYGIGSAGKDGVWEQPTLREYDGQNQATTNFNNDLIFINGSFVRYPEGVQQ